MATSFLRSDLARLFRTHLRWPAASWLLVPAGWLATPSHAQTITYGAPITITQGGTYSGNYQSLASGTPCVRIATNDPVILSGCTLAGPGNLIEAGEGANLTVRNCTGQGLAPTVDGQAPGRFLDAYRPQNLVVEHNAFTQTSGIVVNRWSTARQASQTLTVRYNRVRNIDGRWRNAGGSTRSSFLILNTVQQLAGVDVSYNEVINAPDQSLVEDNINLYNSSGTAQSAIRVHDNFVRGAYPFPATSTSFSGTGMTTDGDASTLAEATGYIEADHNQFVGTGNAAMNLAAGHDVYYHDNRAVTSGTLPDGRRFSAGWAGLGVFNYYNQPASVFFNNRVENNTVGYVRWGGNSPYQDRQDLSPGACAPCTGTISLPNPITTATEDAEATSWQQKLQQAGIAVGPVATAPTTPTAPVATAGQVQNPGFEADGAAVGAPTGWRTLAGTGTDDNADYSETYPGAHSGTYHATHYRPTAYEVYTYQTLTGLASGTYALSAWVKSSGGQPTAQLRARNYGGANLTASIVATSDSWVLVQLGNITVSNGQCEIGFYSKANAGQWLYVDDVTFAAQPAAAVAATNTVLNASFDDNQAAVQSPTRWTTQTFGTTQAYASYTEAYPGAHSGTYHGTHYRPENYEVYTYQVVSNLPAGTYALKAWVKSAGGQPLVQLQAKNYGGAALAVTIPAATSDWVQVTIPSIAVTAGSCEVGFYSKANGGQWLYFDDVELVRVGSASTSSAASLSSSASTSSAAALTSQPTLYPNPATTQATLTASLAQAGAATIVLTDMQGLTVATFPYQATAGENHFSFSTSALPSGLYIVQLKASQDFPKLNLEVRH